MVVGFPGEELVEITNCYYCQSSFSHGNRLFLPFCFFSFLSFFLEQIFKIIQICHVRIWE